MPTHHFETVDVFTAQRFGGNPLAVFPDAARLSDRQMQQLATEFNLSETTFVLPPAQSGHTARVRIFNRTHEMPFAGHPMVGTAFVLARGGAHGRDRYQFEVPAGVVTVRLSYADGQVQGAEIDAPQALALGVTLDPAEIARCVGLLPGDVSVSHHPPTLATVGNTYVIAEVEAARLDAAVPDLARFRRLLDQSPGLAGRFSLYLYARTGESTLAARMFAPLVGTHEDPATGSAATPLAALLLSLSARERAAFDIHQGVKMGRPSLLRATAWRSPDGIRASVGGACVPVLVGEAMLDADGSASPVIAGA
ncbi:MAG: PhzF family phenazine biosynthesis protein [Acidobacteria bacterium]|nr:PhzF family phenazine biosynthesis protein [Acidobacteriota bacterium]